MKIKKWIRVTEKYRANRYVTFLEKNYTDFDFLI